MTIYTALKKIDTLTKGELKHCIQRLDTDIDYYKRSIKNYPQDRYDTYGIPYLRQLESQRQQFIDKLNELV